MNPGARGGLAAGLVLLSLTAAAQPVDTTEPVHGQVVDGIGGFVEERDTQPGTEYLQASWRDFEDPESGIVEYEVAVGTVECGDFKPYVSAGMASFKDVRVDLTPGQKYFITLRVTNGAGLSTTASTDGVVVLLPDGGYPPDAGFPEACIPPKLDAGVPDGGRPDGGGGPGPVPSDSGSGGGSDPGESAPPLGWGCGTSDGASSLALLMIVLGLLPAVRRRSP